MATNKKSKHNGNIPYKGNYKGGRPSIDWELLYDEWTKSRLARSVFLRRKGLDPGAGNVKRATKMWTHETKQAHARLKTMESPRPEKEIAELWQVVQQWRKAQAANDFKTANSLREHCKLMLNDAISKDKDGNLHTSLKPNDVYRVANALESIQRIQRLALGMSTENVGVEVEDNSHIEAVEDDVPTFIVEVNKNGKFVRPKPRQIN